MPGQAAMTKSALLKTGIAGGGVLGVDLGPSVPLWVDKRNRHLSNSTSCICTCTRPIRCSKARLPSRAWPSWRRPISRPHSRSRHRHMFGALEFSEKIAGYGIQPIVGCALAIDFGDTDHGARNGNANQYERTRIVLLARVPKATAA